MSIQTWLEPPETDEYEIEYFASELIRNDEDSTLPREIETFGQLFEHHLYRRFNGIGSAFATAYIARLNTKNPDITFYVTTGTSAVLITCSEHDQETLQIEAIEIMADRDLAIDALADVIAS